MKNEFLSNSLKKSSSNNELEQLELIVHQNTNKIEKLKAEEQLIWGQKEFGAKFALTTSFGIQSAVLLHMSKVLITPNIPKIIWVDTGYLHKETYIYAEKLTNLLNLDLIIAQSQVSPARMEALHGRLWETNSKEDFETYHQMRKIEPLETTFSQMNITCWASGVRKGQTENRKTMKCLDLIRNRLSLRPLLKWTKKDIFYYMQENNLPQHPLFEKGYSTVGDWHSSEADNANTKGRDTRFKGMQEECGIHLSESNKQAD